MNVRKISTIDQAWDNDNNLKENIINVFSSRLEQNKFKSTGFFANALADIEKDFKMVEKDIVGILDKPDCGIEELEQCYERLMALKLMDQVETGVKMTPAELANKKTIDALKKEFQDKATFCIAKLEAEYPYLEAKGKEIEQEIKLYCGLKMNF